MKAEIRKVRAGLAKAETQPAKTAAGGNAPKAEGPDWAALKIQELEPFITKQELAGMLRKSERTIEEWMHKRRIPFYRLERGVRFRWSEIQARFTKRYRVAAEAERAEGEKLKSEI